MDTESFLYNDKNVPYENFSKQTMDTYSTSKEVMKTKKNITSYTTISNNLKEKCNLKNNCKSNVSNIKNKNDEDMCSHQNKLKYKLMNYLNNIKYNLSIKKYFKMLVTVSFLNYLPLHLRNISNNVYIYGTHFNLKDPESLKIFLILCKSKVLFTYRSNFLLNINSNNNRCQDNYLNEGNNCRDNDNYLNEDNNNCKYQNNNCIGHNNNTGIKYTYGRYKNNKDFEKIKDIGRKKEKKKKKRYYKESVINFKDIPEHFLKNIYFDHKECFYINFERIPKCNTKTFFDNNNNSDTNNGYFQNGNNLQNILEKEVNRDISIYSTNDSNNSSLFADNSERYFNVKEENKKNIKALYYCDRGKIGNSNNNNTNTSRNNNNNCFKYQNEEVNNEFLNNLHKNNKQNIKSGTIENCRDYEKNKKKRNNKLKNMLYNEEENYVNFKIKEKKNRKKIDDNIKYIPMSDNGWGCMLRVVQMVLANIFIRYKISKKYVIFHNSGDYFLYKNYLKKLNNDKNESKMNSTIIQDKQLQATFCSLQKMGERSDTTAKKKKKISEKLKYEKSCEEGKGELGFVIKNMQSNELHKNENNSLINISNENLFIQLNNKSNKKKNLLIDKKTEVHEDNMNKNESGTIYIRKKNDRRKNYVYHHFKTYANFLNNTDDNMQNINANNSLIYPILLQFRDIETAKYSIQNIIYEMMKYKKIDEEEMEHFVHEWIGPTSSAVIISNLINKKKVCFVKKKKKKTINRDKNILKNALINKNNYVKKKNNNFEDSNNSTTELIFIRKKNRYAFFSVAFETGVIYSNKVLKFFQIKQKVCIIIWICLKLGNDSINISKYKQSLLSCFHIKQFQGISGGNIHTSAHYFYSANESGLFYLDPHIKCQNAFTSLNKNFNSEFFTHKIKFLPWEYLNSSISLIFVVDSKEDYFSLINNLKLIDSSIFEIYDEEPQYPFKNELNFDTDDSGLVVL